MSVKVILYFEEMHPWHEMTMRLSRMPSLGELLRIGNPDKDFDFFEVVQVVHYELRTMKLDIAGEIWMKRASSKF